MTKTEIRLAIEKSSKELFYELWSIKEQDWKKEFYGNLKWSVHDMVAHMIGWDYECLKAAKQFMKGIDPLYNGQSTDYFNKKNNQFVKEYKNLGKEKILQKLKKSREQIYNYLKPLSNKAIEQADNLKMFWQDELGKKGENVTLNSVLDLSWHDREHLEAIKKFKVEYLALDLNCKKRVYLYPKTPFNFDYCFYNPSHFETKDLEWKPGLKWQTMRWRGQYIGLKFKDLSTSKQPKISLTIYSKNKLKPIIIEEIKNEIIWRYNLNYDLKPFYQQAKHNRLLASLIKKYKGLRTFHPGSLYEYFIIGIVLQNAPVHRTIKMSSALFDFLGQSLKFDNRYFYSYWLPEEITDITEEELKQLKIGYRAKSIKKISQEFIKQKLDEEQLRQLPKDELEQILLNLPGIGMATTQYILEGCFHDYSELKHIPPWELKIYSKLFFKSNKVWPEKKMLSFLNKSFGPYVKLAIHYVWSDLWWQRQKGKKIDWLEQEIRT